MKKLLCIFLILLAALAVFIGFVFRDRRPRIYFATENGDTNYIARYLQSHNVNDLVLCERYRIIYAPLLHIGISGGQLNTIRFLLKNGADPNQPDSIGYTPLMCAIGMIGNDVSSETKAQIFTLLLDSGANPNTRSSSGQWTPLLFAASFGHTQQVSVLLAHGVGLQTTNYSGQTALHLASTPEMAEFLIAAGADLSARTTNGTTPADSALRNYDFKVLTVITNHLNQTNR